MTHLKEGNSDTNFVNTPEFKGKIEFENVSFSYPAAPNKMIIKDFSYVFESNKTTAIFGHKTGKSTLIHLIERNYDAQFGMINIDDVHIEDIEINSLR